MEKHNFTKDELESDEVLIKCDTKLPIINVTVKWDTPENLILASREFGSIFSPVMPIKIQKNKTAYEEIMLQLVMEIEECPPASFQAKVHLVPPENIDGYCESNFEVKFTCIEAYFLRQDLELELFYNIWKMEHSNFALKKLDKEVNRRAVIAHLILSVEDISISREIQQFEKLLTDEEFTDVVLVVGEERIPAHKAILAARSPRFREIFKNQRGLTELELGKFVDPTAVRIALRFLYTSKMGENLNSKTLIFLLPIARDYSIEGLKRKVDENLCEHVTKDKASALLIIAEKYGLQKLKNRAIEMISSFFYDIKKEHFRAIYACNPKLLLDILTYEESEEEDATEDEDSDNEILNGNDLTDFDLNDSKYPIDQRSDSGVSKGDMTSSTESFVKI